MAKAKKPKRRTTEPQTSADVSIPTDGELMAQWFSDIRCHLKPAITPYVDGPLKSRGEDGFPLNLGDGPKWYRPKNGLSDKASRKLFLLKRAAWDADAAESSCNHEQRIPTIFGCALRIGQFTERVKIHISTDQVGKGPTPKLTPNDKIKIRLASDKGHSVSTILEAVNNGRAKDDPVSRDTINRALGKRKLAHK